VTYVVGDLVIYDGSIWEYSHSTDSVASVFGRTGSVVAATNDYTLDQIATPTANFAMGSKKFTGLVNGSSAQDSAAFGQIPTGGTGGTNFCVGNDSRLTDSRTPTAHAASHASAGSDPVTLAQSQITGLVAALALLAPLASPALTGNPTAPTAAAADNDTSIATTAFVQGELASYVKTAQAVNAQTGTTYTLVAADAGKLVTLSNASAITLTLPQDSDATIAIGTYIDLYALGAGQITVAAGTGATLRTSGLTAKSRAQYARFGVQKVSANTWSLFGDLAAS
jgi:hypothetical protein